MDDRKRPLRGPSFALLLLLIGSIAFGAGVLAATSDFRQRAQTVPIPEEFDTFRSETLRIPLAQETKPPQPDVEAAFPFTDLVVDSEVPPHTPAGCMGTADNTVAVRTRLSSRLAGTSSDTNPMMYGSGFLVRPGILVSTAHGFEDMVPDSPIDVRCNGRKRIGRIVAIDFIRDVAVLEADCPGTEVTIDSRPLNDGETVFVSGFRFRSELYKVATRFTVGTRTPSSSTLIVDRTRMSAILALRLEAIAALDYPPMRMLGIPLEPGNSGSVVYDRRGRAVGMVSLAEINGKHSWFIPAASIEVVLTRALQVARYRNEPQQQPRRPHDRRPEP
jgi:S1-C subfamily serine protease